MRKPGIVPAKGSVQCQLAAAGPTAQLSYNGGPLLTNIDVVTIYWGNAWTADPNMQSLENFFNFLVGSSYITQLQEYSVPGGPQIGFGTHSFRYQDTSDPGATVDDVTIQNQLQGWIAAGVVPPSTANTAYFIFLPNGTTVTDQGESSCQQFCGYHNSMGTDAFGGPFYAVENYENCSGCQFVSDPFSNFTLVASHEFAEMITDPLPSTGWVDNNTGNEIGDICVGLPKTINSIVAGATSYTSPGPSTDANGVITVVLTPSVAPPPPPPPPGQNWTVQKLWSNNQNGCV